MPTIAISNDQAAALARGENITIEPPSEDIHNCIVFTACRSSYYVWDGEIKADGRAFFWRFQRVIDNFGNPCEDEVETRTPEDYNAGDCFTQRSGIKRIVGVGR